MLSRKLIERNLETSHDDALNVQWRCERLADELFPDNEDFELADTAEKKLFVDCYAVSQGGVAIDGIEIDQLEDWLIGRAVRTVLETEEVQTHPNVRLMNSEFALHGFTLPSEAGHRWGE